MSNATDVTDTADQAGRKQLPYYGRVAYETFRRHTLDDRHAKVVDFQYDDLSINGRDAWTVAVVMAMLEAR